MTLKEFVDTNWHRGNVVKFLLWQASQVPSGTKFLYRRRKTLPSVYE